MGFGPTREAEGLTQEEAAKALGITRSHLSRVETGGMFPSFGLLVEMCKVYGCEMGDLFPTTVPRPQEFAPLGSVLYGVPREDRARIIQQFANAIRAFAIAFQSGVSAVTVKEASTAEIEMRDVPAITPQFRRPDVAAEEAPKSAQANRTAKRKRSAERMEARLRRGKD